MDNQAPVRPLSDLITPAMMDIAHWLYFSKCNAPPARDALELAMQFVATSVAGTLGVKVIRKEETKNVV